MAKKVNNAAQKVTAQQPQEGGLEQALSRSGAFIEKNKKTLVIAVVAIVVIVAGGMLYKKYVAEPKELRTAESLFPGQNYFQAGDYQAALDGDEYNFEGFVEIARSYGGTKSGKLAKAYAGLCYAQLGNFEEAIKYLKSFKGKDQMVGPAVVAALADCYASTDQLDKAAKTFIAAAKKADNAFLSPNYLAQAALIYESLGKKAEAKKLYETILSNYPNSEEGTQAEAYIEKLK